MNYKHSQLVYRAQAEEDELQEPGQLVYRAQAEEDELHLVNWYTELRQRKMNYTWPTGIQSSDRGR
jgi:hypothetical protein